MKMDNYQKYIHLSRYAKWREDLNRRETWDETVGRYLDYFKPRIPEKVGDQTRDEIVEDLREAILNLEVLPSMRCMMTAGKALEKNEIAGYNCAFVAVDDVKVFSEIMMINMCGTGVGFSVERQFVCQLPTVAEEFFKTDTTLVVKDSRLGWCTAFHELLVMLYAGRIPQWDMSQIRPAGSPLKTFGGRASGPDPLDKLFKYCVRMFQTAQGRKLTSIEVHDLICTISSCTIAGGVRRAALISLSNLSDDRMRSAKNGQWWIDNPNRSYANNSAAYTERPSSEIFMKEWLSLIESKSGERGIFNKSAAVRKARKYGRRDLNVEMPLGTNPCGEITLKSGQFCNLSEVVIRPKDDEASIRRKIRLATILGTLQSTLTNFKYLRKIWKKNCEEERLLGVSLTGICDHPFFAQPTDRLATYLDGIRAYAVEVNSQWAEALGISPAMAITSIKPSGTVSQLVNSSSGIHPRYSKWYVRRVRSDIKDPLTKLLVDAKVPYEQDKISPSTLIFAFPIESPDSVFRNDKTAIEQLETYLCYSENWTEHNPSITVYVKDHEWMEVGAFVYKHFDKMNGVSFLPFSDAVYDQAPYEEITEREYHRLKDYFPTEIPWDRISEYEKSDQTTAMFELACTAGGCDLEAIMKG
jgi:ribonucleoside-diphosphate reductase alpha chain